MICMTVMICYDHRNFSTWVILFSQTFQHHFKNAWVNLDVSFPASKEWTRWTDAVGKLWPGSSGKSAFVQSVFFRLSKWKNVATCPLYPIQVPGKMWRYTHYCPLYIYIYHCDSGFYCTYFCQWIHWYLEGPFACRGLYSPEEERDFIRDHLGPELEKSGFWDQQKDEPPGPPWVFGVSNFQQFGIFSPEKETHK